MSKHVMIGSKVKHNYSGQNGKVLAYRRNPQGYNYQVEFEGVLYPYVDWFKREVLILL